MPMTIEQRLERLRHDPTRYEIEMITPSGARYLVAYTPRKSTRGLLDAVRDRGPAILRILDLPEDAQVEQTRAGLRFSDGTVIRFSGRTQRDALSGGDLPYVEDA